MAQDSVFLPYIVEWGRINDIKVFRERARKHLPPNSSRKALSEVRSMELYTQTNAGGDAFCLPIRNFISASPDLEELTETTDNFILLDSGLPGAFVHILHFFGYTTPLTHEFFGCIDEQNKAYGVPSDRQRRLVGALCTHLDSDHIGGLEALLLLADWGLAPWYEESITEELEANFGYTSFIDDNDEWQRLCKLVLQSVEFCVFPSSVFTKAPAEIPSLFNRRIWSAKHVTDDFSSVSKEIFEKTCGQVLFVYPATESLTYKPKLHYWVRADFSVYDDAGKETYDAQKKTRRAQEEQPADDDLVNNMAELSIKEVDKMAPKSSYARYPPPKHYPDTSEGNSQSLITCYIGFQDGEQIHYAFGGDSVEAVAAEARKRLPANKDAFADLKRKAKVKETTGRGKNKVPVDVFARDATATAARKRIAEVVYHVDAIEFTQERIWDMFQLNHHGSIKNVLEYAEGVEADNPAYFIAAQVRDQLKAKAKGFFVTSPGTKYHADPLILEALAQLALLSRADGPYVNVVHVAYPTGSIKDPHPAYRALKASGVLMESFNTTSKPYRFAQALVPYIHRAPQSPGLKTRIETLLSGVLMPGDGSEDMLAHFTYASDQNVRGPMLLFYRILQLRRFHNLLDPMIFCLEGVSCLNDAALSEQVVERVAAIISAFMDICGTDIDLPDIYAGHAYSNSPNAKPKDTQRLLGFLLFHLCLRYGALKQSDDISRTIGRHLYGVLCALLEHAIDNIWWAREKRKFDNGAIKKFTCPAPPNDTAEILADAIKVLGHKRKKFRETAQSKPFVQFLHSVFECEEWPSLVCNLKYVIFAILQLWKCVTKVLRNANKFDAVCQFYDISAYSDHAKAFLALKSRLCEHGERLKTVRDLSITVRCLKRMAAALSAHAPESEVCIQTAFCDSCYATSDHLGTVDPYPLIAGAHSVLPFSEGFEDNFCYKRNLWNEFKTLFDEVRRWHHMNYYKVYSILKEEAKYRRKYSAW